jgi:glycosyltransferase involved in cell wall biosynthesis
MREPLMTPTRIEYVIDHLNVGGAQRHLVELFSGLDRRRFAPQVCVGKAGGALTAAIEAMDIPVRSFGMGESLGEPHTARGLVSMARRLRAEHVQIVHGYLYMGNILGVLAGALAGTPIRLAAKRSLDRYPRPVQLHATRFANRFAHRIMCNAEAVRRFVQQEERPDPRKLAVIPNGISLATERPAPQRPAGVRADTRLVGTIGRLTWKKAYDDLLQAARRVCAVRQDVEFVMIGDGPLRGQLEQQARELGIRDRVHFLGEIQDAPALLAGFDVFVLSSIIEGMPNVLLEALAAERPAIVTRAGGMPEIVTHEKTGLLASPARPDELATGILRLLADPDEARCLGRAGRHMVEQRFSSTAMIASFERLYDELAITHGVRQSDDRTAAHEDRTRVAAGH